jgi:probable HAF family extracellular repeat protein
MQNLVLAATLSAGLGFGFSSNVFAQETHSYIVDLNSKAVTALGTLGGNFTVAKSINEAGQVAGDSYTAANIPNAFVTGPNGAGMTNLGGLDGNHASTGGFGYGNGVNDAGQVAGYAVTPSNATHAFITGPTGGGMADLGTLGGKNSYAYGINGAGRVVGNSETATPGADHAFITGPNGIGMTDLGTLGGPTSLAYGINAAGQVVGYSDTHTASGDQRHAFITGPNGMGMTDLGTLGGTYSIATGINDTGQVVGYSYTASGEGHAFITGPNGVGMTDLNSLVSVPGVVLTDAAAINNHGQVAAIGVIPEPETYALLLAGLVLTSVMARRRKPD